MGKIDRVRLDGRLPNQLRPVRITPSYLSTAPGSALIEMGETKVICTVSPGSGSRFPRGYRQGLADGRIQYVARFFATKDCP